MLGYFHSDTREYSLQKSFKVGNHSHSCKFAGIFFVLASITVKNGMGKKNNCFENDLEYYIFQSFTKPQLSSEHSRVYF